MPLLAATQLADLTEKEWELQLIGTRDYPGIARQLGWRVYHTLRSKGSQPGWPDWALVRERFLLLELKTEKTQPSDAQKAWIQDLLDAQVEVYIGRPRHLDALARILACRGDPYMKRDVAEMAAELRDETRDAVTAP